MTVWFVALPALLVGCAAIPLVLRRRGRAALGVLVGLDAVLLLASLVVLVIAWTGGTAGADPTAVATAGGGATGVTQATVALFDTVLRLGTNLVSFARLAAFGLTHAAIGLVVWDGTTALWDAGGLLVLAAVVLFVVGNAVAVALEGLVAAVQALRLEYYELFSRVFASEGRPFRPWHVPVDPSYSPRDSSGPTAGVLSRGSRP